MNFQNTIKVVAAIGLFALAGAATGPLSSQTPRGGVAGGLTSSPTPADQYNPSSKLEIGKGYYVTAMCRDLEGNIWVATDDDGIFRYKAAATDGNSWTQFTSTTSGPADPTKTPVVLADRQAASQPSNLIADDSSFSIACDKQGRIWAGHLNHGVSVYNGQSWRSYDVIDGPLGERVFDIAVCPTDGDVWLATSAGLSRYSIKDDSWSYFTRADGLPSDQASAIAFDKSGNLFMATQCDGIAIGAANSGYKTWKGITAPEQFALPAAPQATPPKTKKDKPETPDDTAKKSPPTPKRQEPISRPVNAPNGAVVSTIPLTASGAGLPSNLMNDILVASDGTIYAATACGLAWSKSGGASWQFLRGANWADRVRGLFGGPPSGWVEPSADSPEIQNCLPEDFITCLAEDDAGMIWVGMRYQGYCVVDPKTMKTVYAHPLCEKYNQFRLNPPKKQEKFVLQHLQDFEDSVTDSLTKAILPISAGAPWIGTYNAKCEGLALAGKYFPADAKKPVAKSAAAPTVASSQAAAFPPHPSPAKPPTAEELQAMTKQLAPNAAPLAIGKGMYLGEDWSTQGDWVGRYGRQSATLAAMNSPMNHEFMCGPDAGEISAETGLNATLYESIRHWCNDFSSDDIRSLHSPMIGIRRRAEWDDHGEEYAREFDGPNIWVTIDIPTGLQRVALFFSCARGTKSRDFTIELRPYIEDLMKAETSTTVLARARVKDFNASVYKSFLVMGPGKFHFKINRNQSHNTHVAAIMIDKYPRLYSKDCYDWSMLPYMGMVDYVPPVVPPKLIAATQPFGTIHSDKETRKKIVALAIGAWDANNDYFAPAIASRCRQARILCYRSAAAYGGRDVLLERWRWLMLFWADKDRQVFARTMALGWNSMQEIMPNLKLKEYRPYSPNTWDTAEQWKSITEDKGKEQQK